MKTTGKAFEESFTVTLRGEVIGNPLGCGSGKHEKKFLEEELHAVVSQAIARYYQVSVQETSIEVTPQV